MPRNPGTKSAIRVFALVFLLFAALTSLWAWTTPLSASPDEPAHIVKAASVVRGQWIGAPDPFGHLVEVPGYIAFSQSLTCTANEPMRTADCAPPFTEASARMTTASTTAGLYNPAYYLIVGWPSLIFEGTSGIYAMRLMSGLASSFFIASSVTVLAHLRRPMLPVLTLLVAVTPMTLFLSASVNPNGLEITATLCAFVGMMSIIIREDMGYFRLRCVLVALAASVAVNMRGISPIWVAIALFVPLMLLPPGKLRPLLMAPAVRGVILAIALATVLAVAWTVGSGSLSSGLDDKTEIPDMAYKGASPLLGFFGTLDSSFLHAQNMVGIFGWLDTPVPLGVYFIWSVLAGGLALACVVLLKGKWLWLTTLLGSGVIFIPAILQAIYIGGGGFIWQGRYTLPLFVCFIVASGFALAQLFSTLSPSLHARLAVGITALWILGQFAAYAQSIRRYSVGISGSWIKMVTEPNWTPLGGNLFWLVMGLLTALATGIVVARVGRRSSRRAGIVSSLQNHRPKQMYNKASDRASDQRKQDSVEKTDRSE